MVPCHRALNRYRSRRRLQSVQQYTGLQRLVKRNAVKQNIVQDRFLRCLQVKRPEAECPNTQKAFVTDHRPLVAQTTKEDVRDLLYYIYRS